MDFRFNFSQKNLFHFIFKDLGIKKKTVIKLEIKIFSYKLGNLLTLLDYLFISLIDSRILIFQRFSGW